MRIIKTVAGPTSYPTGGFDTTIGEFEKVTDAQVSPTGGYKAEVVSITGNVVKTMVRYYDYDAAADGGAIQVPAGTDLSGVNFTLDVEGI